ncbi:MAG TPA: GNAT family N-acetyltransferase [Clostridia bacterium]|nr:GNAT family N-acetyltransferase [Clostridia bacterium]
MIRGRRILLRPLSTRDLAEISSWDDDEEVVRWVGKGGLVAMGEDGPHLATNRCFIYGIENEKGLLIGYIALIDIIWRRATAELRVCIGKAAFRNKGYGTEAIRTFLEFLKTSTTISQVYLRVYRENERAIRCYEKCGFKKRAVLRAGSRESEEFKDLVLMELCPNVV